MLTGILSGEAILPLSFLPPFSVGFNSQKKELASLIPAKFYDFSMMLTNLKDSHDLMIVFWKKNITHEFKE